MADSDEPERTGDAAQPPLAGERVFSPHAVHLMRTAQMNGLTHARMADQKASILAYRLFIAGLVATLLVFAVEMLRGG